jgi:putative peptidoglycan lipid II flippase
MGRLYSSTYYAVHDTKTPLRFASIRIVLTLALGYLCAIPLPKALGLDPRWGSAGLTASAGVAGWIEFSLLRWRMNRRIGRTGIPARHLLTLYASAAAAAVGGWEMWLLTRAPQHRFFGGIAALATFGIVYLLATIALGVPEATTALARIRRRR